jgi:hypothetical protein
MYIILLNMNSSYTVPTPKTLNISALSQQRNESEVC